MKKLYILSILLMAACVPGPSRIGDVSDLLQSPDGRLEMSFGLSAKGEPMYQLTFDGKDVILPSGLGFELKDGKDLREYLH